jgi:hypothetical protein
MELFLFLAPQTGSNATGYHYRKPYYKAALPNTTRQSFVCGFGDAGREKIPICVSLR